MKGKAQTVRLTCMVLLLAVVSLGAAACSNGAKTGDGSAGDGDRPKVAALFTQFVDQGNWDPAGYSAYQAMCDKYDFDCTYVEEASYEQAPALLRGYGDDGYDMVITHSSGYAAAIEEIAPDYPETEFVLFSYASDTKGLDNYSAWSMDWDQVGYMLGVVGALASDAPVVGVVAGEQIPSTVATVDLIKRGVAEVEPETKVAVSWVGSWTDAAKAKELALKEINDGAGFVIPVADTAGAGVQQAADEGGALTLGEYLDQSTTYPKSLVTSYIVDMQGAFDEIGQAFTDGTLDGQIVQMSAETGDLTFTPFKHVDPALEDEVNQVLQKLADGSLSLS
jgi:basic membrane protein A and related proteins